VIGRIGNGKRILALTVTWTPWMLAISTTGIRSLFGEIKDGFVHGRGTVDQEVVLPPLLQVVNIEELGFDRDLTFYVVGSVMEDCDGLAGNTWWKKKN